MAKKQLLLEKGVLTISEIARLLKVSKQAVSLAVKQGRIRSQRIEGWSAPVIPVGEVCRLMEQRGMTHQQIAARFYEVGKASGWGEALIVGLLALGLGLILLTELKRR